MLEYLPHIKIYSDVISVVTVVVFENFLLTGLEKYLNSTLPIGEVTLKFCLPGGLLCLPKFSNTLIIHELKNGSQTTGMFFKEWTM